jgi:ribosomal protein S12 methylthiotransferase
MAKVAILSLGCPRNLVDSETIVSRLKLKGYQIVDIEDARIGILNTCSFIKEAKEESIETILDLIDLKKQGRLKKIIVYGCLPQRYAECSNLRSISSASRSYSSKKHFIRDKDVLIKELPEVDAFVGRISLNHTKRNYSLTPRHYAYVKVCEGCINNCSFCVIPKIKGKFTSRSIDSVIEEVKSLDREGVSEINIIGQDITLYGKDLYKKFKLVELLKNILSNAKNINWVRLLYLHPSRITDGLLDLIKNEGRITKYIDLPLQHINRRILKLMNRDTTRAQIFKLIEKIRKKIPGVALRTSLIAGFPSETDKEFNELLEFIEEIKFERLGVFMYSREEGTAAYNFKPQVSLQTKQGRFNAIMSKQQRIAKNINEKFLGKVIDVLIEEKEHDYYLGRSQYDAPEVDGVVFVKSPHALSPGKLIKARITDTLEYDLVGELEGRAQL